MIAITKKINPIHAFIVILLFQTILMVAKGYEKDFFHVDEALTFMLANSEYGLEVPEKYKNEWRPGSDYYDLLTVSADNTFNYKQVYINQTNDVHPPLYYFVIHTVSSFFPLQFSKWFGILPNIFFFLLTQVFIFLLSSSILNSRYKALLPCALYGFSLGAVSTVEFMRMYSMTAAILMIALYINYKIIYESQKNKYIFLLISINTSGYLTHYYYIIHSFFLCSFIAILLFIKYSYKDAIKYTISNLLSLLIFIFIYPVSLFHIFSGVRGTEAFHNLAKSPSWDRIGSFYQIISKQLFCSCLTIYILCIFCYLTILFIQQRKNKNGQKSTSLTTGKMLLAKVAETKNFYFILLLVFISISSFLIIAKISAYTNFRYIAALFPIFCILTSLFICTTASKSTFLKSISFILVAIIIYSGTGMNHATTYKDNQEVLKTIAEKQDLIITELSPIDAISPLIPKMHLYKNVYFLTNDNLKKITDIVKQHNTSYNDIGICILYPSITDFSHTIDATIKEISRHYIIELKQNTLMTCIKIIAPQKNI